MQSVWLFYQNVCVYVVFLFTPWSVVYDFSHCSFQKMLFSVGCNSSFICLKTKIGPFQMKLFDLKFYFKDTPAEETHSAWVRNCRRIPFYRPKTVNVIAFIADVCGKHFALFCFLFFLVKLKFQVDFHLICALNLQCCWYTHWLCRFHFPSNLEGSSWVVNNSRSNVAFSLNLIHKILHLIDFAYMLIQLFVFLVCRLTTQFFSLLFSPFLLAPSIFRTEPFER